MKNNINRLLSLLMLAALFLNACTPEEYELGSLISKSDLQYSITQDSSDPNTIILESQNQGLTPLWVTPMGRSTKVVDSVKLAFPGTYKFVYGVQSDGGFVQADTFTLEVTTTNLSYVDDPMWDLLTGGVGSEKTWYLDLDADAVSKYFAGPLYYAGTSYGYGNACEDEVDCWSWEPDYAGNTWLMTAGDYGSMTFSLAGNATATVNNPMLGTNETGTYFLDADAKTLSMTDAEPLHDSGNDGKVVNWGDLKIISLTENTMQLAALRDPALSGEGAALLVYNYISKDYADSWSPEETGDPEIVVDLGDGTVSDAIGVSNTKTWKLSTTSPFDWASIEGEILNGWENISDYPDWAGYTEADVEGISSAQIQFSANGSVTVTDNEGASTTGTYTVDESTNVITFADVTPSFSIGTWVVATTTADNEWKIIKTTVVDSEVTDIWFGQRDPENAQYMVFHFVAE